MRVLSAFLIGVLLATSTLADTVRVQVDGIDGELRENVLASLSLVSLSDRDDLTEAAIRMLHRRANDQISGALQPYGYYAPTVQRRIERQGDGNWLASYVIDPGPVVLVSKVDVQLKGAGQDHPAIAEALERNRLQTGRPLRHTRYQSLKTSLRRAALDNGYLDTDFEVHELRVDPENLEAQVSLVMDTGDPYFFGEITIDQDAVTDSLALAYLDFQPGEAFNQTALLDAQYALQDSGYYSAVNVSAERERATEHKVPIQIAATARKRQRYSAGLGYATDVGPRVSLGWENRRINNRGHRGTADVRFSQVRSEFATRYIIPFNDPRTDRYIFSLAHLDEDLGDDIRSKRDQLSATQARVLGQWQRSLYLQLSRELSEITTDSLSDSSTDTSSTDTLLLPGISFSRTSTDSPVQPQHASRISADLRGSHTALGADTSFARLTLETRLIRPIGKGRLLLRADLGISQVDAFAELPVSQRFFTGGDRSVRGFGFDELGPRDAEGRNIGGRHSFAGSIELEWPITGPWSTALFLDGGNAFNQFGDELEYSVGIGGRLRTPIGVIRLDVAKPITVGKSPRLHIGLGPDL